MAGLVKALRVLQTLWAELLQVLHVQNRDFLSRGTFDPHREEVVLWTRFGTAGRNWPRGSRDTPPSSAGTEVNSFYK